MARGNVRVSIDADVSGLKRGVDKANRELKGLNKSVGMLKAFGGAVAGYFAVSSITDLAQESIGAASDINESLSKNQVLFGKYSKNVERFSNRSAEAFGISKVAALEYTGVFGNLFTALGVSGKESSKFSVNLTKLAADMASFNNTSIEDALEAIRSGLVGETEPLRKFGVNLSDAQLRIQAMKMGLTDTTKNVLTPYQKAMASQALIVKQTDKAHGDFHRTQKGAANQSRILAAQVADLKAKLGDKLLPIQKDVVTWLNKMISGWKSGTGAGGRFRDKVEEIWKSIKPTAQWLGRAAERIKDFADKHPIVYKLAGGILAVGLAVKTIKFASAITGLSDFVSASRGLGKKLVPIFRNIGQRVAGVFAANAAETAANQLPTSFNARKGKFSNAGRSVGLMAGRGVIAGLASIVTGAAIVKVLQDALDSVTGGAGNALKKGMGGNNVVDLFKNLFGGSAEGGAISGGIPGKDSVPRMLMPGEHVLTAKEVQNAGGHSAIFALRRRLGGGTQARGLGMADGGIVGAMKARAEKYASGPYDYGGGHGGFGVRGPKGGFDCSGYVSAILGPSVLSSPMAVRSPMAGALLRASGPDDGPVVVGIRGTSGRNAHTMIRVEDGYYESGSGHGARRVSGWSGSFEWFKPRGVGGGRRGSASGFKKVLAGATVFTDAQGYKGDDLTQTNDTWAELGDGKALGGLPYLAKIKVTFKNGKSLILTKRDIGHGGKDIKGNPRAVDIHINAAKRVGIGSSWSGVVKVEVLGSRGKAAKAKGKAIKKGNPQARPEGLYSQRVEAMRETDYTIAQGTPGLQDDAAISYERKNYWQGVYDRAVARYNKSPTVENSAAVARASQQLSTWSDRYSSALISPDVGGAIFGPDSSDSSSGGGSLQASIDANTAAINEMNARAKAGMGLERRVIAQAVADMAMGQVAGPVLRGIQSPSFSGVRY